MHENCATEKNWKMAAHRNDRPGYGGRYFCENKKKKRDYSGTKMIGKEKGVTATTLQPLDSYGWPGQN
jgi:hypothetical protein